LLRGSAGFLAFKVNESIEKDNNSGDPLIQEIKTADMDNYNAAVSREEELKI